jgi:hypothetical protein
LNWNALVRLISKLTVKFYPARELYCAEKNGTPGHHVRSSAWIVCGSGIGYKRHQQTAATPKTAHDHVPSGDGLDRLLTGTVSERWGSGSL